VNRLLVIAIIVAAARAARADQPDDLAARTEKARTYYQDGTSAYNLGDFQKAIELYKAAYTVRPESVYLYNIAQAYRLDGNLAQALFFYKSYLRNAPDAVNRAEVERRIAELQAAVEQQMVATEKPPNETKNPDARRVEIPPPEVVARAAPEPTPGPAPAPADQPARGRPIYKRWWFWAGVGAVAVGAVAIVTMTGGGEPAPDSHFGTHRIY